MRAETTRFAPSPTGHLHLGHAYAALFAERFARQTGGRFLLRIEDIDTTRCRPQFTAALIEDLRWLGLSWEEPVRVQSAHFAEYRAVLVALSARGLVYPCFCSRAEIAREAAASASAPHVTPDGAPRYPGTCRRLTAREREARLAAGAPYVLRLDMARALSLVSGPLSFEEVGVGRIPCNPAPFGDVVLARRDVPASYHLAVTHDDALQGVSLVTRAEDLRPATALHRLLQTLMGWPEPRYAHHPLLRDASGQRLAKRSGATPLRALGLSPAEIRARLGFGPA
jgi:glutamyl-Q tRNA(Asp) synthetase